MPKEWAGPLLLAVAQVIWLQLLLRGSGFLSTLLPTLIF